MRDKTNTLDYQYIIDNLKRDVPLYDVSSFFPTLQAFSAIWKNRDPRTGDNLWKGSEYIDPHLRAYQDTPSVAKNVAQVIPGASPLGIQKAAGMIGSNPITSFFGYLLRDITPEEKSSMTRTITGAVPGLSGFVKWTRPNTDKIKYLAKQSMSDRQRKITDLADSNVERIKSGDASIANVMSELRKNPELNAAEKKDVFDNIKRAITGWKIYDRVKSTEPANIVAELPSLREWQAVSGLDTQTKVKWFVANKPVRTEDSYKAFMTIAKSHGFLSSSKFFYYLRQAEKGTL